MSQDTENDEKRTIGEVSTAGRVMNAKRAGFPPMAPPYDLEEGIHCEVLAYTDWADLFIPTVVRWANGEIDRFTDPAVTMRNKRESIQQVMMEDEE